MMKAKQNIIEHESENTTKLCLSDKQVRVAFFHLLGALSANSNAKQEVARKIKEATLYAIRNEN